MVSGAVTASADVADTLLNTKAFQKNKSKLIACCCVAIVAYYLHRFLQSRNVDPVVQINDGRIRGRVAYSRVGREFYEFLGIPYALPPIDELRFQSPVPVKPWKGILSTRRYKPKCMQVDLISHLKSGSDDCLYLNVYMPKKLRNGAPVDKPLPVIVFIHGGYYVSGHPALYGPRYLMDQDIVLVSISYRLGALGFLNLGIREARGNQGMKDQVLALKWVQDNIHYFGGDKNLVTIIGQSAGGSSVHFHMLSKMSKGLFHRAVSHSGTILSPWAISYSGKEQALRLAALVDCPINGSKELTLECLKAKDVNKIVEVHDESINFFHDPLSVFKPSIEEIDDEDAFITEDPVELMRTGNITTRVPWMIGVNSEEGLAVATVLARDTSLLQEFQLDWQRHFRNILLYSTKDDSIPDKIRSYYFGSQSPFCTQQNLGNFSRLFSEREYFLGTHQSALYHHAPDKSSPVYLFYFAQPIPLSFGDVLWAQYGILPAFVEIGLFLLYDMIGRNVFGKFNPQKGVTHVDDFTMLFEIQNIPPYSGGSKWEQLSREMVHSWVTFAKTGEPAPVYGTPWNQALSSNQGPLKDRGDIIPNYMKIRIGETEMVEEPFNEAIRFWKSLNISVYKRSLADILE